MLELTTSQKNDILIVSLNGPLDSRTSSDFKAWIEEKMLHGFRKFALNCINLEYFSSRGIGILTELSTLIDNCNGSIVLFQLSQEVYNLITFLKLDKKISIAFTLEDAFKKAHESSPKQTKFNYSTISKPIVTQKEKYTKLESIIKNELEYQENKTESIELQNAEETQDKVIFCPNCGQKLRIKGHGKYACPPCQTQFSYPFC